MRCLGDLISHADVLASVGLGSGAVGGRGAFSRRSISGEIVNHLSIKLLNSLGLSTTGVATTRASGPLTAASSLLSGCGLVLLGLRGGGRLGTSLLTVDRLVHKAKDERRATYAMRSFKGLGAGTAGA